MTMEKKVVLYKSNTLSRNQNFHLGYRGFSAPPSLKSFVTQKLLDLTESFPKTKFRVLIEKGLFKGFYVISLHSRIKGKDVFIRSEDTCPYGGIKKSINHFLGQFSSFTLGKI